MAGKACQEQHEALVIRIKVNKLSNLINSDFMYIFKQLQHSHVEFSQIYVNWSIRFSTHDILSHCHFTVLPLASTP